MRIAHSIFLSFGFILLLFTSTTFVNYRLSKEVTNNTSYFAKSTNIIRNSGRFQRNVLMMVNGLRGYLLTGEKSFIESYDTASHENEFILQELSNMVTDSAQSEILNEITRLNDKWTNENTEPLKQAKALLGLASDSLGTLNRLYKERFATGNEKMIQDLLRQKFKEFSVAEYKMRDIRKEQLEFSVRRTKQISFILTAISFVTALIIIRFLVKKIATRIAQITKMANTIAKEDYNTRIIDIGKDELSSVSQSLNYMAGELSQNIYLLKSSNAELDQFAHIVSHDLKGPLRGIGNVVNWIEEDHYKELSPKLKEYIQLIKGRIHRAENLIEGLLSYARINKESFPKETVDVNTIVHEVVENLSNEKNISIDINQLPTVFTERILLIQIFSNLIENAIKYNDKENPLIKIYHQDKGSEYEFFVEDNGIGIATAYHKRIYAIFQTLADGDGLESTGVGLAIVRKILESKKQTINLKSIPGEGSIFSFTWPKE